VQQEIDQGEIISPLLWIIYYDPMFSRINNTSSLSLNLSITQIRNIYNKDSDIERFFNISVLGYLDDTTWFASSKEQLKQQFQIANSFYEFSDIQINHDKYEILTNQKNYANKTVTLQISDDKTITVKTVSKKQGKCILEVYINAFNSKCESDGFLTLRWTPNHLQNETNSIRIL
jgi:hypothetical protein